MRKGSVKALLSTVISVTALFEFHTYGDNMFFMTNYESKIKIKAFKTQAFQANMTR